MKTDETHLTAAVANLAGGPMRHAGRIGPPFVAPAAFGRG